MLRAAAKADHEKKEQGHGGNEEDWFHTNLTITISYSLAPVALEKFSKP